MGRLCNMLATGNERTMAGYSGTSLAKKLSLKDGMRAWRDGMPDSVSDEIGETGCQLLATPEAPIEIGRAHV